MVSPATGLNGTVTSPQSMHSGEANKGQVGLIESAAPSASGRSTGGSDTAVVGDNIIHTRWDSKSGFVIPVSKAGQLEAAALDSELSDMLKDQLNRVLAFFRPSLMNDLQPELDAAFRSLVFYFSVWTNNPTPGNMYQNLQYVDARRTKADPYDLQGYPLTVQQRCLHACTFVIGPWIWARLSRFLSAREWGARPSDDWRRKLWLAYNRLEALHKCASLLNFALFLVNGRYRSLGDRLLHIRLLHMDPMRSRSLNFEYMNQLLVWQSLLQFLTFLKPLASSSAVRDWLARRWPKAAGAADGAPRREGECAVCRARPIDSPHGGECGHAYCYYCLRTALMRDPDRLLCAWCSAPIRFCRRIDPPPPPPPPASAAADSEAAAGGGGGGGAGAGEAAAAGAAVGTHR